jgi:hypothetical protein
VLDQTEDGRLVVELVWPGSPAAIAGMCLGDVLLLIDGMQGSVSSVDVARDLILGAEGTMVTLQVLRGITQLEFGPVARIPWATMQQVLLPSCYSFSPSFQLKSSAISNQRYSWMLGRSGIAYAALCCWLHTAEIRRGRGVVDDSKTIALRFASVAVLL